MKRVFLDMDGVVADWHSSACALHGLKNPAREPDGPRGDEAWDMCRHLKIDLHKFYKLQDYDFWVGIKKTIEADFIIDACIAALGKSRLCFLSSPCFTIGCCEGKREWVNRHYPGIPLILSISAKLGESPPKDFLADNDSFLIDDCGDTVVKFSDAGGWTYLWPRPWNKRHMAEKQFEHLYDELREELERFAKKGW